MDKRGHTPNPQQNWTYRMQKRTWIQKNPRLFVGLTTAGGLLIFFSRPIYDIFIRTDRPMHPKYPPIG